MASKHIPVLIDQIIDYLQPAEGQKFIDCTLGAGGYTLALKKKAGEQSLIVAIDQDEKAISEFQEVIKEKSLKNIFLINFSFGKLKNLIIGRFGRKIEFNGIVFDLGLSSDQLNDRERGFSFQDGRPLNMAFSHKEEGKTQEIVNHCKEQELLTIIRNFGEERYAARIAKKIVEERKKQNIKTTGKLKSIIEDSVPYSRHQKIHPATKTFQALRIATNEELSNLQKALPQAIDLLVPTGKVAVVSYHGLEDRIVKNFFRQESKNCICPSEAWQCQCGHKAKVKVITKKVVTPTAKEKQANPRSRSAKLRVAEKI